MSNNYDNWERLVVAVLRREKDRQLALAHSRESSISSSFDFGVDSPVHEQSLQLEASSSKVNKTVRFSAAASGDTCGLGEILPTVNWKIFSLADLKIATGNFKPDMILGVGGFGAVFKGWVDSKTLSPSKHVTGTMVAIKKLNPGSIIGSGEWQREANFLGRLSHPNLVKLHGYCWKDEERSLVYEFMQRGSLENHLFRRSEPLSWDIMLKIAIGAARGLAFLHTSVTRVIYRDFKASNILLDVNYNAKISAKISDWGLPKLGDSHVTTRVMGTHGYAAPEYVATGHFSLKSDVYGFGVVLFEMLTGLPIGQHNLVDYSKPSLSQEDQYSLTAALQLQATHLALRCLESEPRKRPPMEEVVETLEQIAAIGKPKENAEVLITSPYPPEEDSDSDSDVPQPYTSEDEESEDELGDF